ncbi:MAG TPA: TlpA disulfide reductase family protein [Blastocatellia bacterium]|nr:TlpA disulfide reductase family protein [Blastocatellia bacterium]
MLFRNFKPWVLGLALLFAATVTPERSRAALPPAMDDVPELPAPDGSSDTPEIEVTMVDGKKLKLSSLRGKVVVLDMFASWCHHCQDHAPLVTKIYNQFKPQGFVMLSLATDRKEDVANVKKFIKDYGLTQPVGYWNNELMAYYADNRNHSVPQVVMFGKDGKMKKRWIGWSEDYNKELIALIEGELGSAGANAAAPAETKPDTKAAATAAKSTATKTPVTKSPPRRKN